ncbi:MAG: DUF1566 domain-containing protein [Arcobacter sp.]|nr:DUF1566 domain-containing protein [Arcobacter sp.]
MKNSIKSLVLGTFVSLSFIACGGGGGGSDEKIPSNKVENSKFIRVGESVVDKVTKIQWQDDIETRTAKKVYILNENCSDEGCSDTSGDTAETYCKNLKLGGYTNWRIPTLNELLSIVDRNNEPHINSSFQNTSYSDYWSSEEDDIYSSTMNKVLDFYNGYSSREKRTSKQNIRCVRDIL